MLAAVFSEKFPVSYFFGLTFMGDPNPKDAAFKEASGLSMEMEIEEIKGGGENHFKYKLPGVTKYSNLVLKRGLMPISSPVTKWIEGCFAVGHSLPMVPTEILVTLYNEESIPAAKWIFHKAYPVKWSVSDMDSMKNEISIETMEFTYQFFTRIL